MVRTIHHRDIRVKDFYATGRIAFRADFAKDAAMKLRIAKLRRRQNPKVSQAELGDAVGVGQNSISRIERGEQQPTLETLEAIADYLRVDFIALFEDYNRSDVEQELRQLLYAMNDDQLAAVLSFARMMVEPRAS